MLPLIVIKMFAGSINGTTGFNPTIILENFE